MKIGDIILAPNPLSDYEPMEYLITEDMSAQFYGHFTNGQEGFVLKTQAIAMVKEANV